MDKKLVLQTLEKVKSSSKERKFTQTIDVIFNLKDINLKKSEEHVDIYVDLPHARGKSATICGLVDKQLLEQAKKEFDYVIDKEQFDDYKNKPKEFKKIAGIYDYFVAQATIMPLVAKNFGPVLGKKGKIPNPKAGCVVPPNADLSKVKAKLVKTVRLTAKTHASIKCPVGTEKMPVDEVVDNIMFAFSRLKGALPKEIHNIKNVMLKVTMGPAFKVEAQK